MGAAPTKPEVPENPTDHETETKAIEVEDRLQEDTTLQTKTTEVEEKLKDLTECCICLETYKDPKILPCVHTFCKICLEKTGMINRKKPGDQMSCPLCKHEFAIPVNGFAGLKKNFFMDILIDIRKNQDPLSDRSHCEVCLKVMELDAATQLPHASLLCVDCRLKDFCEIHKKNPTDVFCFNCTEVVCMICFLENHKKHEGSSLGKVVSILRKHILTNIKSLSSGPSDMAQKARELKESRAEFIQNVEGLESEINLQRLELKDLVDTDAAALLFRLKQLKEKRLREYEAKKDDLETQHVRMDSFKTYCEHTTAKGSARDICRAYSDINTTADELKHNHASYSNSLSEMRNILFKKTQLHDFLMNNNIVGSLSEAKDDWVKIEHVAAQNHQSEIKEKPNNDYDLLLLKTDSVLSENQELKAMKQKLEDKIEDLEKQLALLKRVNLTGTQSTSTSKGTNGSIDYTAEPKFHSLIDTIECDSRRGYQINGLAILGNELFVVINCEVLEAYDLKTLTFRRKWIFENLSGVYDMTQCKRNECLYLASSNLILATQTANDKIFRFEPKRNLKITWPVEASGQLSITSDGNVLLADQKENTLYEYTPNGNLVRATLLAWNSDIEHPLHAIKLTSCHFLISHGKDGDLRRGLCIIDDVGNVKKFAGKVFKSPSFLNIDSNGNIMVADYIQGQLVVLNPDLNVVRTYNMQGVLPLKMNIDEIRGRLFVIEYENTTKNCRLAVYALRKQRQRSS